MHSATTQEITRNLRLAWKYIILNIVELIRTPGAMASSLIFPSLFFMTFVLPQVVVNPDRNFAVVAVAQLCVFAFFTTSIYQVGFTITEMRHEAWFVFLKTLPVSPVPYLISLIVVTTLVAIVSIIPILFLGALLTNADLSIGAIFRGGLALLITTVPFCLLGAWFGYTLSQRSALGVISLASFVLAFLGGLFVMPDTLGSVFDMISMIMPTRGPRELVAAAFLGTTLPWWSIINLVVWSLIILGGVVWSSRRDWYERYQ
ncbi:ABC transporter permease [Photorhabdus tasmaniensis]|uniref:ABC transporter permease n=1 Tax=Photorhabdus tasmaniensis TaxID=1004159 RepID=UPI0040425C11